ncbi:MAG TPA: hypothetical protein VFI13_05645 [Gemmatimonadales bacterium]|nr:hypothetical protein [Gemmatimonadales bacterium]
MMRTLAILCVALAAGAAPLAAQGTDTLGGRAYLRDRIEQAFLDRAREEMSLSDDQVAKLQATSRRMFDRRQALQEENRRLTEVLTAQMRPGIAGDPRVIRTTLDSIITLRVSAAQLYREEQRELAGYLTDVQRAQYHLLRERLLARVEAVRAQRMPPARAGARRPGARRP